MLGKMKIKRPLNRNRRKKVQSRKKLRKYMSICADFEKSLRDAIISKLHGTFFSGSKYAMAV